MATTFDHIVTADGQSPFLVPNNLPLSTSKSPEESILDLSQRSSSSSSNDQSIDNWNKDLTCIYTDHIDEDFNRISINNSDNQLNIQQSLTDQLTNHLKKEHFLSDNSNKTQSQMDFYSSNQKTKSLSSSIPIHELVPCLKPSPYNLSNFLWSKYFHLIGERSVSDEYFDHYLASIESSFKIDMKLEYCYDIQQDLYWLTQIQLVSHCLLLLHYVGLADDDTTNDFWTNIYDQRCHPIGWCKQNSKVMSPPLIVTQRAIQQISLNDNLIPNENENHEENQTLPTYLFNKDVGLTPVEQLKVGMLLEIQDLNRPWTLWFGRIINNQGGRLTLRYIISEEEENSSQSLDDIHIFYLDYRVHPLGWTSNNSSVYSYDIPTSLTITIDKQLIIDQCLNQSLKQILPADLFKEQEQIVKHRFTEGMKLEVFQIKTKNISIGTIGKIHNEFYFDVIIDDDDNDHQYSFVAHSTHPHILPPHWAAEHKLILMNGKGIRQSDDYWNLYTEKNGFTNLAPERYFNLMTINATGTNRVEPGMKMEMIYYFNKKDYVFSVTLIHVADHLMWLRVDDTTLFNDEKLFYHVLPINSLDVFPVGWAKFNGFQLITPMQYSIDIKTYQQDRYHLFSSVTHNPKIPRVYLNEIYLLTIYVNIRCFCGPNLCSSRLARIPSQFGPGPYRHVLIDMFHHLLSATSTHSYRALRRLDHQINSDTSSNLKTEHIKGAKKTSKLIRPISIPTDVRLIYQYLRHICTQLEACPNLISMKHIDNNCPDKCHLLNNTFVFSTHSKHKRTQLRAAQNRYRKQKSLLCHLKNPPTPSNVASPVVEEIPSNENSTDNQTTINNINDLSEPAPVSLPPGSDRQTRGFRFHIEPKTHTITRTNKKQKLNHTNDQTLIKTIKEEPMEINNSSSQSTTELPSETKRSRTAKKKRSSSPSTAVTSNILSSNSSSSSNQTKKKRRPTSLTESYNDLNSSSNITIPKIEVSPISTVIQPTSYSIQPPIDRRNPITWNVNEVCYYLNESGCSFALKTIKEQEIDGAALLLLDDLDTVQNLLEFKLGPAVKFFHVIKQLRSQVIDTFHSSPSLKTSSSSSRLLTK